ncbi:MAG TPA: carboxylesterase family protein [Rhodanobacteraceae bacterium]|nr:carboxylesterase family protein [Rhodanobacteraceae bacterium]
MKLRVATVLAAIAVAFIVIPSCIASTAPTAPVVQVASGRIRGVQHDGVDIFKGIPFAAPPAGRLRWRPPQPVKPWAGVRPAIRFGHDCMQILSPGDATPRSTRPSEDCLYLNVWAPVSRHGKLPVIVWIYGGGFVNGGSSSPVFDGAVFAHQGLVFVSFNYRLGRFGFFAFPALVHQDTLVGNYAFMDQIAALRWVRKNIAAFGGDPDNVTIFGESAGGMSVNVLLTSPLARGLFERAIVESGGGRNNLMPTVPLDRPGPGDEPSAEQSATAFARSMGITGDDAAALAALRTLPAGKIVDGLNMSTSLQQIHQQRIFSGPIVDGKLVVQPPEQVFKEGGQVKVPVIIGTTSDDLGFFDARTIAELFAPFAAHAAQARAAFDPDNSRSVQQVGWRIAGVRDMLEPARFVARRVAAEGQPAWEYRFSYVQTTMRKTLHGAPHFSEVPFVFESLRQVTGSEFSKDVSDGDRAMARTINAYWVNFARTGNPNGPGLPQWPAMTPGGDQLMNFTMQGPRAEIDPVKKQLDLVEPLQR